MVAIPKPVASLKNTAVLGIPKGQSPFGATQMIFLARGLTFNPRSPWAKNKKGEGIFPFTLL
jgi:hypothetical protein